MKLRTIGKRLVIGELKSMLTCGENNADILDITLPKMYGGVDLSGFSFKLRGRYDNGNVAEQVLPKIVSGESIVVTWSVTSDFTALPGTLAIELVGVSDGEDVIKFTAEEIQVKEGLLTGIAPPKDVVEQALAQMQLLLGAAQEIRQSTEIFVSVEADRVGFRRANETAFTYTGSLKGRDGSNGIDGSSFAISGIYPTLAALQSAHPIGTSGDAYAVGSLTDNSIYIWGVDTLSWVDIGKIKGTDGASGTNGAPGKSAYTSAQDGGFLGTESEFNAVLSSLGDLSTILDNINREVL